MKIVIILAIVAIILTVLGDALKRRSKYKANHQGNGSERLIPADEAPPTETGRLRVKHIVDALKKTEQSSETREDRAQDVTPAEEALPDPFEKK